MQRNGLSRKGQFSIRFRGFFSRIKCLDVTPIDRHYDVKKARSSEGDRERGSVLDRGDGVCAVTALALTTRHTFQPLQPAPHAQPKRRLPSLPVAALQNVSAVHGALSPQVPSSTTCYRAFPEAQICGQSGHPQGPAKAVVALRPEHGYWNIKPDLSSAIRAKRYDANLGKTTMSKSS